MQCWYLQPLSLLLVLAVTALAGSTAPTVLLQFKHVSSLSTRKRLWMLPSNLKMDNPILRALLQDKKTCRNNSSLNKASRFHFKNTFYVSLIARPFSTPFLLNGEVLLLVSAFLLGKEGGGGCGVILKHRRYPILCLQLSILVESLNQGC